MEPTRREALALGAAAPLLLAAGKEVGPPPTGPAIRLFRIYATPDGESHIERIEMKGGRKPLPVASVLVASFAASVEDWHTAPFKTFTINTTGNLEVQLSDGTRQAIGPGDLVYLEDVTGKGHITRLLTPGGNLFLRMPDDFDVKAWASS